ncbi:MULTISPECIES: TlpA disulfide reductase family protein [unclassified Shewanella]|jgi:thiol-disulfide isomerase/thioredoxin|uniref:TlpA family protein disulfide reductase n=1 Tax=unclassified Shewanella TaxID=196818 RepID=UPI000C79E6E5|nr:MULTISPECIES: TlpA disulfide reductase family protein [unclassified Shewanella]PKG56743.1 TlpA family protein disulfide reductase [Shewanella sp. GutDb-MelDb]PKG74383.1 TlpA family protein disulfide reductase [Shewanella sp. GutCb]
MTNFIIRPLCNAKQLIASFLAVAALSFTLVVPAHASLPTQKVYNTGQPIEKPMIMSRFIEMSSARQVPNVSFVDTEGGSINLKQFDGKVILMSLWATWCAPCLKEIPQMEAIKQANINNNLVVLPVSIDEESDKVAAFLARHDLGYYHTWLDPEMNIDNVMPADVVPATYVFDGSGNLIGFLRGYLDWSDKDVQPYLEKLISKYAKR